MQPFNTHMREPARSLASAYLNPPDSFAGEIVFMPDPFQVMRLPVTQPEKQG